MRNSSAHPLVPLTPAVVDQNGGAPATSGGGKHGYDNEEEKLRYGSLKQVPAQLGTTRSIPGGRGGTGEVGGALAAERLAGSGDEDAGTMT